MKNLIIATILILFVTQVKAQDAGLGAPKELTCTEKAFNFSFAVGQKLKISAPKMGPVEAATYETDYIPAWALKANAIKPEKSQLSIPNLNSFKIADKFKYSLPAIEFRPVPGYSTLSFKPLPF